MSDLPEVTSEIGSRHVQIMRLDVRLGLGGGGAAEEDFIGDAELMPISLIEGELHGHGSDFLCRHRQASRALSGLQPLGHR